MKAIARNAEAAAIVLGAGTAQAADSMIGVPNWPSVNATSHVLKVIIKDNCGLDVELQNANNPVIFEAMDRGSMHVHPEYATLEWVDWFNNRRLLGPIGNIPPAEAEANHYAASENLDIAA